MPIPSITIEPSLSGSGIETQRSGGEKLMPKSVDFIRMRLCLPFMLLSQVVGLQQCAIPLESSDMSKHLDENTRGSNFSCQLGDWDQTYSSRNPSSNCWEPAADDKSCAC